MVVSTVEQWVVALAFLAVDYLVDRLVPLVVEMMVGKRVVV